MSVFDRIARTIAYAAMGCAIVLAIGTVSCSARQRTGAGVVALLDCEAADLAQAMVDLVPLGIAQVKTWIAGDGTVDKTKMRADLAVIRSDLGRCVLAAAVAAADSPTSARSLVARPDLRAEFSSVRGELAWPVVRVAGTSL